jgi:hypothetical protein
LVLAWAITQSACAEEVKLSELALNGGECAVSVASESPRRNEWILNVAMTYTGRKPLKIYEASLPWKNRNSMVLVAVTTNGFALKEELMVDDPGAATRTIKPGEILSGRISLHRRFPALAKALADQDIILFWSCQLRPVEAAPLERTGGWLLLRKSLSS